MRGVNVPVDSANGGSDVIDYLGNVLVAAGMDETITAHARRGAVAAHDGIGRY